jgi:hypothetical protein
VSKLPKNVWINGWYIALTYNHSSWGERYVWAGALFADLTDYGGPWLHVDSATETGEDFRDSGLEIDASGDVVGTTPQWGGRKTNGTAVTEDIQVLYNGPRKFIGMFTNHIYDYHEASEAKLHLVDVTFTIIFNKVKKEIIVLKDVKRIQQPKYVFSPLTLDIPGDSVYEFPECILVQFSNREEWDLGAAPEYSSYVHFYTAGNGEANNTCYNEDWTITKTLPGNYSLSASTLESVELAKWGSEPKTAGTYDVAQIISDDLAYVGWAAYWPSLSDWSADAGSGRANEWWRALKSADGHDTDSFTSPNDEPFLAPLTVGEWDFVLAPEMETEIGGVMCSPQFRGVTIYGVSDRNDGDDEDRSGGTNILDKELVYQVEEYMNPWDLYDAVHKKNTTRWYAETSTVVTLDPLPVNVEWDAYCTFAERVTVIATGVLLERGVGYTLDFGTGVLDLTGTPGPCAVTWSSDNWYETIDSNEFGPGRYEWGVVGRDAASVDSAGAVYVAASLKQKNKTFGLAGADMYNTVLANQMPYIMNKFGSGDTMADYMDTLGRAALNDNWCTYWPVASSNVFGVGGPLANTLSYYANDFTDAFYGLPTYSGSAYSGMITGVPCWNRGWDGTWNVYSSDTSTGYAVISTYKDINGTVIFEVWGHWGRDTYYATQWLHGDAAREINPGILQLQAAPRGLTSIILEICYTDPEHPTFSIPECLGTITETEWIHTYTNIFNDQEVTETKGGIHDP